MTRILPLSQFCCYGYAATAMRMDPWWITNCLKQRVYRLAARHYTANIYATPESSWCVRGLLEVQYPLAAFQVGITYTFPANPLRGVRPLSGLGRRAFAGSFPLFLEIY